MLEHFELLIEQLQIAFNRAIAVCHACIAAAEPAKFGAKGNMDVEGNGSLVRQLAEFRKIPERIRTCPEMWRSRIAGIAGDHPVMRQKGLFKSVIHAGFLELNAPESLDKHQKAKLYGYYKGVKRSLPLLEALLLTGVCGMVKFTFYNLHSCICGAIVMSSSQYDR